MKIVLGISGLIGSGKSTAGMYFESLGSVFINADEVVNDLYKIGNDGYLKITQFFGDRFLDVKGQIDRALLSKYVFDDVNKLKILNKMIHPLVFNETIKRIDKVKDGIIVIEAVYFDNDMIGKLVDKIVWIECDMNLLKERALSNGMTENLFLKISTIQHKPEKIDFMVYNNGTKEEFRKRLYEIWKSVSKY